MYLETARADSEDRPASYTMDTKTSGAWPTSAKELSELYTSMRSWHAQGKSDLYRFCEWSGNS